MADNRFAPVLTPVQETRTEEQILADEKPVYDHGFSQEQVLLIKNKIKEIEKRDLATQPVTLEEFKLYVVPWQRILRTEAFILNPVKEKAVRGEKAIKEAKQPKEPKVAKPKKMTKKATQEKLNEIIMKRVRKIELTEEEEIFYQEQTAKFNLL